MKAMLMLVLLVLAGCQRVTDDMARQPRHNPDSTSPFFADQQAGIFGSLFPCQLPRMRLFVKSNQRKNDSERLKKARVRDRKAGFCFYASTKRQRNLRFLTIPYAHLLTHNAKLGWWR